jgi:hypothetical protein
MFKVRIQLTATYDPLIDELVYDGFDARVELVPSPGLHIIVGDCDGDGELVMAEDEALAIIRNAIYGSPKGPPTDWVKRNRRGTK